tara:strand:+ start:15473 stop:16015 length:543 start_codon:yes stop_codon:yes gene_type:complete
MTDKRYIDGTIIESGRPMGPLKKGGKWIALLNFMDDGDSFLIDKTWLTNHGYKHDTEEQMDRTLNSIRQVLYTSAKNPKSKNNIAVRRVNGVNHKRIGIRVWALNKIDSKLGSRKDISKLIACCLCGNDIEPQGEWYHGNNAEPLEDGRCCNSCNLEKVVPARLDNLPISLKYALTSSTS